MGFIRLKYVTQILNFHYIFSEFQDILISLVNLILLHNIRIKFLFPNFSIIYVANLKLKNKTPNRAVLQCV